MDALLLDYNGVVVSDEHLHFESFREALRERGIAISRADYDRTYLGVDDRAAFRKAFELHGMRCSPDEMEAHVQAKSRRYQALAAQQLAIVPGVGRFVREAARRCHVAVVSGALRSEIPAGLERAGISDLVEVLLSSDDVSTSKPDPTSYRTALRRLAETHAAGEWRALVIEDSLPGIAAARALGAGCLAISTSHPASDLAQADLVWDSFEAHEPPELDGLWRAVSAL